MASTPSVHVINDLLAELQRQRAQGDEMRARLREALAVHEDLYRLALPPHLEPGIAAMPPKPKLEI